jgi:two-component system sensor histidine kinase ChvG
MALLADEHMTSEPRGGRGYSFARFANAIGLKGGKEWLSALGFEQINRIRTSVLARRIITFNLIALCVLLVGMLYLSQYRGGQLVEIEESMRVEADLYAATAQARVQSNAVVGADLIGDLTISDGRVVRVFMPDLSVGAMVSGVNTSGSQSAGVFAWLGNVLAFLPGIGPNSAGETPDTEFAFALSLAQAVQNGEQSSNTTLTNGGDTVMGVARPVLVGGALNSILVMTLQPGYLDGLIREEQRGVIQLFLLAVVVSVLLSLTLANTIASPIHDLARAAEAGTTREGRQGEPTRVRIPDLSGRSDEIGRLSRAMRDMTSALYDRIETNEEFAADVAHEIKNPLASLRSAVETLRIVPEGKGRVRLLDVIEHDVRRLDRLVSDISNASRLDAELVKEEEEPFDLTLMLSRIAEFHTHEAKAKGVELIWSEPPRPIVYDGMEARLAQVFVNLISNAISFCGKGDAVRIWAREKENRVLIVVEDTGPGIPEDSLTQVFKRFYSERPADDYGNNSGLGLSISKQIVEAHKGVIWAENIRASDGSPEDAPLGARFVVGLPV